MSSPKSKTANAPLAPSAGKEVVFAPGCAFKRRSDGWNIGRRIRLGSQARLVQPAH